MNATSAVEYNGLSCHFVACLLRWDWMMNEWSWRCVQQCGETAREDSRRREESGEVAERVVWHDYTGEQSHEWGTSHISACHCQFVSTVLLQMYMAGCSRLTFVFDLFYFCGPSVHSPTRSVDIMMRIGGKIVFRPVLGCAIYCSCLWLYPVYEHCLQPSLE